MYRLFPQLFFSYLSVTTVWTLLTSLSGVWWRPLPRDRVHSSSPSSLTKCTACVTATASGLRILPMGMSMVVTPPACFADFQNQFWYVQWKRKLNFFSKPKILNYIREVHGILSCAVTGCSVKKKSGWSWTRPCLTSSWTPLKSSCPCTSRATSSCCLMVSLSFFDAIHLTIRYRQIGEGAWRNQTAVWSGTGCVLSNTYRLKISVFVFKDLPCNGTLEIDQDSLEECPAHGGYDYFEGSEIPYIIIWTCVGLLPLGLSSILSQIFTYRTWLIQSLLRQVFSFLASLHRRHTASLKVLQN